MNFSELIPAEQKVFREMTAINYGRLDRVAVLDKHALITAATRSICTELTDPDVQQPHQPSRNDQDYILSKKAERFLAIVRKQPDGTELTISISNGLPGKVEISRATTAQ